MNQLKQAEQKATQLVQDARKARSDRMRESKAEAEAIIAAYRAELEAKYQQALSKVNGSAGEAGSNLTSSTNSDISQLSREFAQNKGKVEDELIKLVTTVNPKAPEKRE